MHTTDPDSLICAEIMPVLPNLSAADRRLIGSHEARPYALATVIGAAEELLAERPAAPTFEPPPSDPTTKARSLKRPLAAVAALVMLAVVAALAPGAVSKTSTRVAAVKTAARSGAATETKTAQLPPSAATAASAVDAPVATVPNDTVDNTVPDYSAPPLPTSPPTTEVVCPTGRVTATVSQVQARQSASDPTGWDVSISGVVTNGTGTPIVPPSVNVTLTTSGGTEPAYGDSNSSQLAPGQSATWNATSYVSSATTPTATAQPGKWVWIDSRYSACPSG